MSNFPWVARPSYPDAKHSQVHKTTVYLLKSNFCMTAHHKFAKYQNMCNFKPSSQVLHLHHITLCEKIPFSVALMTLLMTLTPSLAKTSLKKLRYKVLNQGFSHDITKIHTKKLSILLSFYFHEVSQHLKTLSYTNFRFQKGSSFCDYHRRRLNFQRK